MGVAHLERHLVALERNCHHNVLKFRIFEISVDGLFVVAYCRICARGSVFGHRNGGEHLYHLLFHFVGIEVSYYDDTLLIGTIPFVVIIADYLRREVANDLHLAYRHLLILVLLEKFGQDGLHHAELRIVALTPLFLDHTAFCVDFAFFKKDAAAPVAKAEKHAVHKSLVG